MPIKKSSAGSAGKQSIIQATNLTFARNGEEIIHHFSFEIKEGDYVGVIGPNGGGKTTLIRLLLGLLVPTEGSIRMFDGTPTDAHIRKQIGYVAQRGGNIDSQFPATVEEVVRSGRTARLGLFGVFGSADEKAIAHAVEMMGIEKFMKRPIGRLSGGERQKVLLARALAGEPKILFLDEPVDGLDPASRDEFYNLLRKLNKDGLTIISVSHDVHTISQEARSAICLKHQLVCHGTKACLIGQEELKDLFHKDRKEILHHHH